MTCMSINLKLYFDDVAINTGENQQSKTETAIKELFDDIFGNTKEYIKTEVKILDIKEVI